MRQTGAPTAAEEVIEETRVQLDRRVFDHLAINAKCRVDAADTSDHLDVLNPVRVGAESKRDRAKERQTNKKEMREKVRIGIECDSESVKLSHSANTFVNVTFSTRKE